MSYPQVSDEKFNKKITVKYGEYKIPKKKKTFNQICFPSKFELQLPQQFLPKYISPNTPYTGALVYHGIGSGKTCTAVSIAEEWKKVRKIIVLVPASLVGNFRGELRSMCAGNSYLTTKERDQLAKLHPSSKEYKKIIAASDERINKNYEIYSYNKFVELAKMKEVSLVNKVLIIDEVQNMISEDGTFYKVLYDTIHQAPQDLRVILLSATPMFDKPVEIALTMNLLRIPFELPTGSAFDRMFIKTQKNKVTGNYMYKATNMDIFKERIRGYVSYYRGAPPYVFPETLIKYVRCDMEEFQYKSYIAALHEEEKKANSRKVKGFTEGEILELPTNFFLGTRLISNVAFPNKNISQKGFESFSGSYLKMENLMNYSIKFYKIMKKIAASPGPVFVYSNFLEFGGLKSFAKVLKANGYSNYLESGEGKKRFAIMSGDESQSKKDEIKNVYNQKSNTNGSKLKVLLLSPSIKAGISLFSVRQVHILEPYWNMSNLIQIMGRASRYCSHKNLPEDKRDVRVYIYIATHQSEEQTVDQYIAKLAKKKHKLIQEFELALKEAAVDCDLNKNANVFPELGEPDIKCDFD